MTTVVTFFQTTFATPLQTLITSSPLGDLGDLLVGGLRLGEGPDDIVPEKSV